MADQADVETVLAALASGALYPSGTSSASVPGPTCRIYRGWPNPSSLDSDLAEGTINVTVFPLEFRLRNVTRYPAQWTPLDVTTPTLTVSVNGVSATFGGTADPGQLAGLLIDGKTYVYRTEAGDTPALVAANLATLVRADRIALLTNASVGIPGAENLEARTVADGGVLMELRRQEQVFRITAWCPDPVSRDAAAAAIDASFAGRRFLDLPDGTQGRLLYVGTAVFDQSEDAALYRRDLLYSVEYATTQSATQPAMLFGTGAINTASFTG